MLSNDEAAKNLAANVQRLLGRRQWTQADLARRTGDNENTISRVVRGKNAVSVGILARIAEAFDVSSDRLLMPPPPISFEISSDSPQIGLTAS